MNRKIPELQRQLLDRVAGEPITDAAAVDVNVSNALIKKRLVILLPAEGDGGRLIVTAAGLAALARSGAKKVVKTAAAAGAIGPRGAVAHADPRPKAAKPITAAPAKADPPPELRLPKGKLGALAALLQRPEGASVAEMMAATGWQAHSVRGAMSGSLKKNLGLVIESEKAAAGRVYRLTYGGAR